ncbi:hypothetical protein [Draconibacterium sediminis]|uniref:hypothetical protein n=1 Tax=Draconibacterium sediminis TaxID=1544798 RepID=UPI0026EB9B09|nr:hypothetical protein [Draconibacterium sediminis]
MKILYITTEGISSTVFYSQVYSLCKNIKSTGINIKILNFQKVPFNIASKQTRHLFEKSLIKTIFYKEFNTGLAKKIEKYIDIENCILHCRNPHAALLGLKVRSKYPKVNVIYDVRGISELEHIFHGNRQRAEEYGNINRKIFNTQNIFYSFISNGLKQYYERKYNVKLNKSVICPSVYNDKDFIDYSYSPLDHRKKFIYIGGNQQYQNIENIIDAFKNSRDKLVIITHNKIAKPSVSSNIEFYSNLKPNEIFKIAQKCDFGIIHRSNDLFNMVATPTKISEYWGNGLQILAINNAGAFSDEILKNERLGIVVPENQFHSTVNQLSPPSQNDKLFIREFAEKNYSLSKNTKNYIELYHEIFNI